LTKSEVPWEPLSWTPPTIASSGAASVSESPSTLSLCYSSSSTESSSGDRMIQMSSFIDVTPSPGQFVPLGTGEKSLHHHHHHDHVVLDVDSTSGIVILSSYTFQGLLVCDPSVMPDSLYSHWTTTCANHSQHLTSRLTLTSLLPVILNWRELESTAAEVILVVHNYSRTWTLVMLCYLIW